MRHFKDSKNEFFGIEIDQEHLIQPDWVEITKADIDIANTPSAEQLKQRRIYEIQKKLKETDYKVLPDYDKPNDNIKAQRQAWRDEIRQLGG